MTTSPQQRNALAGMAPSAVAAEQTTGCPAELTAAQWIIESNWGAYVFGNNAFGIKWYPGAPYDRQLLRTHEFFNQKELAQFMGLGEGRTAQVDMSTGKPVTKMDPVRGLLTLYAVRDFFGTWPTMAAGFAYHGRMLQEGRYQGGWLAYQASKDVAAYCKAIGAAGYSSTPGYGNIIASWATHPDIVSAMAAVRGTPPVSTAP